MLETERLIIRKFKEDDGQDLFEYLSIPEIYDFEPGKPIDVEYAKQLAIKRSNMENFFAVVLKDVNKMIGHLYFNQIDPMEYLTWELGYILNPRYQRFGYCSEASMAIVRHAFSVFHAHKVVAFCDPLNVASWKVLEKIGMEKEGFFKQKAFFRKDPNGDPIWHDCYAYGLLNIQ